MPVVVTSRVDNATAERIQELVAQRLFLAASVLPLWEDIAVAPKPEPQFSAHSAGSVPA